MNSLDNRSAIELNGDSEVEKYLLDLIGQDYQAAPIFILGAPRTGSTLFYQLMLMTGRFPFISNMTNSRYSEVPIVGLAIQKGIQFPTSLESRYGKTKGVFDPSEGSAVLYHWFQGKHPSQIYSTQVIPSRKTHMRATLACAELLYEGRPMIIKNAWNCFRILSLAYTFPRAKFLWIKRDMRFAAASDLRARRITKGNEFSWNSATPAKVNELQCLPPEAQVIENQYEFNIAIEAAFKEVSSDRCAEVWYEELLERPHSVLSCIFNKVGCGMFYSESRLTSEGIRNPNTSSEDFRRVSRYSFHHIDRFQRFLRCESDSSL